MKWLNNILTKLFKFLSFKKRQRYISTDNWDNWHISDKLLFNAINMERVKKRIPILFPDAHLYREARTRSAKLYLSGKLDHNYFYKKIQPRLLELGFKKSSENIASGHTSAGHVVNGWINSDDHKRSLLSRSYKYLGASFYEAPNRNTYICMIVAK